LFALTGKKQPIITVQTYADDKNNPDAAQYTAWRHGTVDKLLPYLSRANMVGAGCFVMVNEGDGRGRSGRNVTRVRALFADFDGTPLPDSWPLRPHIIVESSPGKFHAYWRVDGVAPAAWSALQKAVAARFGSDPTVHDLPRVLRLPGFLHQKPGAEPFRSRLVMPDPAFYIDGSAPPPPYPVDKLIEALGLVVSPPAVTPPPKKAAGGSDVPVGQRHDFLVRRGRHLRGLGVTGGALLTALTAINDSRCNPPVGDDEVAKVAQWADTEIALDADGNVADEFDDLTPPSDPTLDERVAVVNPDVKKLLQDMLRHYLLIADGQRVIDLRWPHPSEHTGLKLADLRQKLSHVQLTLNDEPVPITKVWQQQPKRLTADYTGYVPGESRLYTHAGSVMYNLFAFPPHAATDRTDKLGPFTAHMAYLFPHEDERRWVWQWLAHMVQRPEERPLVTPLMIARPHGVGRGLLVQIVTALLGRWNVKSCKMSELIDGQFNDFLHETLVLAVHETRESSKNRFEVSDKLRSTLTEPRLEINRKYGFKGVTDIYARVWLMSNSMDPLKLPDDDRRILAITNPEMLQSSDYYRRLAAWLNDAGAIAQLFHFLKRYDISDFELQRSWLTPAKERLMAYGRSFTEQAFAELLASPPREVMTVEEITDTLRARHEVDVMDGEDINEKQLIKLLKERCVMYARRRVDGKARTPWGLTPTAVYTSEEVSAMINTPLLDDFLT
jgi:hypothetical protein